MLVSNDSVHLTTPPSPPERSTPPLSPPLSLLQGADLFWVICSWDQGLLRTSPHPFAGKRKKWCLQISRHLREKKGDEIRGTKIYLNTLTHPERDNETSPNKELDTEKTECLRGHFLRDGTKILLFLKSSFCSYPARQGPGRKSRAFWGNRETSFSLYNWLRCDWGTLIDTDKNTCGDLSNTFVFSQ